MDTLKDILDLKHKCFTMELDEVHQLIKDKKQEADQDHTGVKHKEYVLANLVIYDAIYIDPDFKEVEEIYQRLVEQPWKEDEPDFPFAIKILILANLYAMFNDLGHYTRSNKILEIVQELVSKDPDNSELGEVYVDILCDQSIEIATWKDPDIENYIAKIDEVISKYNFDKGLLDYFDFKKEKIYTDYYSSHNIDKGLVHFERMMKYSLSQNSVYWNNVSIGQLMTYGSRYLEKIEPYLMTLEEANDALLKNRKDKDRCISYLHCDIVKLALLVGKHQKEAALEISQKTLALLENNDIEFYCKLNYKTIVYIMMFGLDPEKLDQIEIMQVKKDYVNISKMTETEESYIVNYTIVGLFGTISNILQAMGMQIDPELSTRFEKFFKRQKETYTKFFSSLDGYLDIKIAPALKDSLEYVEAKEMHDLHQIMLTLKLQNI